MWKYLYNTEKLKYVKGDKPKVSCILCAIREKNPAVASMEIHRTEDFIITANLYPFNPGHIMIFPARHIEDIRDFSGEEAAEMHRLLTEAITVLKQEYNPTGFNIGFNMGKGCGESISHLHQHVIPRYGNEVGFADLIAGTRLIVADPMEIMDRLKARFAEIG